MRKKSFKKFFNKAAAYAMAALCTLSLSQAQIVSAAADNMSVPGEYLVPIQSLTSSAPLPAVQKAFAGALGSEVRVNVSQSGAMTATANCRHMIIEMGGSYHANILTVEGAVVNSSKTEIYSAAFGMPDATQEIEVPDEITFPLADNSGVYTLPITVDFMNSFLGGGAPYPTAVTLTLDFANAKADSSELQALIESCRNLLKDNYTEESWGNFETVLEEAQNLLENGGSMAQLHAMIDKLQAARAALVYSGADYSKVETAIGKVPANASLYTEESWSALESARNEVKYGLTIEHQESVDAWAAAIEDKIAKLVYKNADYSQVDEALKTVPADLTKYTEESVQKLQDAIKAVVRDLKANEQEKVDNMAKAVMQAVKGLVEKSASDNSGSSNNNSGSNNNGNNNSNNSNNSGSNGNNNTQASGSGTLDKDNLKNGIYEVSVWLWHATNDQASMAADSLNNTARIVVENGKKTMYIYTKQMAFGNIQASLQEMKVADANGNYADASVQNKDASGNPTSFAFSLPHTQEFIKVKVNPKVEMMGNQDLDARLRVDYTSLKQISEDPKDTGINLNTQASGSTYGAAASTGAAGSPKTGDEANPVFAMLMMLSAGAVLAGAYRRKRMVG